MPCPHNLSLLDSCPDCAAEAVASPPEVFVATNNVMTPEGVVSVISWEVDGKHYMTTGKDLGLALAAASLLETERKEQS